MYVDIQPTCIPTTDGMLINNIIIHVGQIPFYGQIKTSSLIAPYIQTMHPYSYSNHIATQACYDDCICLRKWNLTRSKSQILFCDMHSLPRMHIAGSTIATKITISTISSSHTHTQSATYNIACKNNVLPGYQKHWTMCTDTHFTRFTVVCHANFNPYTPALIHAQECC